MEPISIKSPFPGAAVFFQPEMGSTMDEARRLMRLGLPSGTAVVTDHQTSGRGRFPERKWEAETGKSLLCTLALAPDLARLPGFPLRMGLAVCRSVDLFAIRIGSYPDAAPALKWPNDVLIADRKIAGILCEASSEAVYVGFGINLNQISFPPELAHKATSLALATGKQEGDEPLDRNGLLELVLDQMALVLGETSWRREAEAVLWHRGERCRFLPGLPESGNSVEGEICGLSESGAILIKPEGSSSPQAFAAGELLLPQGPAARGPRVDRGASNHIR
jgi:BirA family biotin operon repressor/biotin-[acetyl-CoA-carboxylase] ligase